MIFSNRDRPLLRARWAAGCFPRLPAALALSLAAVFALGATLPPQRFLKPCPAPFDTLLSENVFRGYRVSITSVPKRPVSPEVRSGKARLYRTTIREGAKQGPNFADHFTIIPIGCGAATVCLAIMDANTGKVYFPQELRSVEALLVDTGKFDVRQLNYRRDSRLLLVVGSPNEQRKRAGVSYYIWRSNQMKLVRFEAAAKLCSLPKSTQF